MYNNVTMQNVWEVVSDNVCIYASHYNENQCFAPEYSNIKTNGGELEIESVRVNDFLSLGWITSQFHDSTVIYNIIQAGLSRDALEITSRISNEFPL